MNTAWPDPICLTSKSRESQIFFATCFVFVVYQISFKMKGLLAKNYNSFFNQSHFDLQLVGLEQFNKLNIVSPPVY